MRQTTPSSVVPPNGISGVAGRGPNHHRGKIPVVQGKGGKDPPVGRACYVAGNCGRHGPGLHQIRFLAAQGERGRMGPACGCGWPGVGRAVASATTEGTHAPVGTHPRNPSSARVPHPAPERLEALDAIGGKVAPGMRRARPPRRTPATRQARRRAMPTDSSTGNGVFNVFTPAFGAGNV